MHTQECKDNEAKMRRDVQTWIDRWPGYCRSCYGWGGHSFPGNREEPPDFDPCEKCSCNGICGRCGALGLESAETGDGPCKFCEWNYDDGVPELDYYCTSCMPEEEMW